MGTVTYNGISDYEARNAVVVNAVFDAFVTESLDINAENFRDEGLDESSIAPDTAIADPDKVTYAGVDEVFNNTSYSVITYTAPATTFRLDNAGNGWTLLFGEHLRIRFGVSFAMANNAAAPYTSETLSFIIKYRRSGVTTTINLSQQEYQGYRWVYNDGGTGPPPAGTGQVDTYRDASHLSWNLEGNGNLIEWVEIHSKVIGGNYTLRKGGVHAIAIYR
jgi:hypothetical protein